MKDCVGTAVLFTWKFMNGQVLNIFTIHTPKSTQRQMQNICAWCMCDEFVIVVRDLCIYNVIKMYNIEVHNFFQLSTGICPSQYKIGSQKKYVCYYLKSKNLKLLF